ncbi:molybdopterin molybdotransferase MoeA [Formosa sp. S-31]|uniref:molybdopterin molybdotransferase MoeA n=1 Tax=Formosa sp. S-31 TaxID=2790949 RepID=UPI003EBB35A4
MISVTEALGLINATSVPERIKPMRIEKTLGLILGEDITAPINMPPFRQSAMDGYAFIWSENDNIVLHVIDTFKAGDTTNIDLKPEEAVRIFTGAKVPDQADTVVMQEHVNTKDQQAIIIKAPKKGANVRPVGEQVKKGDVVLKKGLQINEATIGFLAGLGIRKVAVIKPPKIAILVTGNELQNAGTPLADGAIYESNSIMLKMALKRFGYSKVKIFRARDTLKATKQGIKKGLKFGDVLLISGGISVGDYDFVKEALESKKVKAHFYKINQKPGKPLWFGQKDQKFVFALPGNPASALTCFYVYALPLIKKISGIKTPHLQRTEARISSDFNNNSGKSLFLKATLKDNELSILQGQQSSMLHTFSSSNVLAYIPEDVKTISKGDAITCIKLNSYGN